MATSTATTEVEIEPFDPAILITHATHIRDKADNRWTTVRTHTVTVSIDGKVSPPLPAGRFFHRDRRIDIDYYIKVATWYFVLQRDRADDGEDAWSIGAFTTDHPNLNYIFEKATSKSITLGSLATQLAEYWILLYPMLFAPAMTVGKEPLINRKVTAYPPMRIDDIRNTAIDYMSVSSQNLSDRPPIMWRPAALILLKFNEETRYFQSGQVAWDLGEKLATTGVHVNDPETHRTAAAIRCADWVFVVDRAATDKCWGFAAFHGNHRYYLDEVSPDTDVQITVKEAHDYLIDVITAQLLPDLYTDLFMVLTRSPKISTEVLPLAGSHPAPWVAVRDLSRTITATAP